MNKLKYIEALGIKAKKASEELINISEKKKNQVLKTFYSKIKTNSDKILKANKLDIQNSKKISLKIILSTEVCLMKIELNLF